MSRRKKTPEERLINLIQELGMEQTKSLIRVLELLWEIASDSARVAPDLAGMVKQALTVPKSPRQRQTIKISDIPCGTGTMNSDGTGGQP